MADHLLPNVSNITLEGMTQRAKGYRNDHYHVKQFVNTSFIMSVRHSSLHLTVVADKQVSLSANVIIWGIDTYNTMSTRFNSLNATGQYTFMIASDDTLNKRQCHFRASL